MTAKDDRLAASVDILRDLIAFPTLSSDSNLDMIAYMAELLQNAGGEVEVIPSPCGAKANLFATFGPKRDGGILLSGHCDVVPVEGQEWSRDPFILREEGGLLYGRGTCDMKGFVAACIAMAVSRIRSCLTD